MEKIEGEEWVADENEKSETVATLLPVSSLSEQQELQEEQIVSPEKELPEPPKPVPPQAAKLEENTCIQDNSITLVMLIGRKLQLQGRLRVTNQRLTFLTVGKNQEEQALLELPIGYLVKCQRSIDDKIVFLQIFLKYGCTLKLRCKEGKVELSYKAQQIINQLIRTSAKLAIQFGAIVSKDNLCMPISLQAAVKESYQFQNQGWKRFPSYPQKFMVPLNYLSKNNQDQRLVVFSFKYKSAKEEISVWRTGPGRADPTEEEWVGKSKLPSSRFYTLDIKNKGIGSSKSQACRMIELQGLPLIKEAFSSLYRIAFNNHESLKWLSNFNQTRWLDQIAILLQEASALVSRVVNEQSQMITILADSDIRGGQLAALAQVLLFPEYRTLSGFGELMQRQLLQWGYPKGLKREQPERGPGIIQFLDAVYQLTCIYPLSFQFSQNTLVFLAENVYSNRFGNFLLSSKAILNDQRQTVKKCWSVWACLNQWTKDPTAAYLYMNPFYVDFKQCDIYQLKQFPSSKHLRIWNGFFFKRLKQKNLDYHIFHRYQQIYCQHFQNKRKTELLRKQLSQQHKILMQRREILKDLKALQ